MLVRRPAWALTDRDATLRLFPSRLRRWLDGVGQAADGEPLEWSDDRYLATRVTFTLENTVANAGLIRRLEPAAGR